MSGLNCSHRGFCTRSEVCEQSNLMGPSRTEPNGELEKTVTSKQRGWEDFTMKKKFSVEQIVSVHKQAVV